MCNSLNEPYNKPLKPAGVCNSGVHHPRPDDVDSGNRAGGQFWAYVIESDITAEPVR